MNKKYLYGFLAILLLFLVVGGYLFWKNFLYIPAQEPLDKGVADGFSIEIIQDGLVKPWDVEISVSGDLYFTQRGKGLFRAEKDKSPTILYNPDKLDPRGEGGMLGLVLSNEFNNDRTLFVCYNRSDDIVVEKLILNELYSEVQLDEIIIENIPTASSGRHSGCRLDIDPENYLWVTTGDAADSDNPQDFQSLAGKILRVDKNGKGHPDNLVDKPENADPRIFSYGHRNSQGLVLFDQYDPKLGYGFATEHGPSVDDEINPLLPGNFGWDPISPYIETVPMTDKEKFPDAIESVWSSGSRTIAISEIEKVEGEQWGEWDGSYLVAALKDSYILRFELNDDDKMVKKEQVVNQYGRIRDVHQAPDGSIYFTTDEGEDDVIAKIVPN